MKFLLNQVLRSIRAIKAECFITFSGKFISLNYSVNPQSDRFD